MSEHHARKAGILLHLDFALTCLAALVAGMYSSGCLRYRPLPIEAPGLEAQYRARSLADPGLQQFIRANAPGLVSEWPPHVLGLEMATLIAAYFNPSLDLARSQVQLARADLIAAGARVNPAVDSEPGYNADPDSHTLFSLIPRFTIETAGKRKLRIQQAYKNLEAAQLSLAEEGWQVRSQVRQAFYAQLLSNAKVEILRREEVIRAEIVDIFDKRLSAGEVARPEYDIFRVDLINNHAAMIQAEGEAQGTKITFANAAGLPVSALEGVTLESQVLYSPPGEGVLPLAGIQRAGLLHRTDLQRMLAEYSAAEVALQLEIARQRPDIELGPGYGFDQGFNRYVFSASIASLPLFHRNQGPIAEAEAQRQKIQRQFVSLQATAIGEFDLALTQYHAALGAFEETGKTLSIEREREETAQRLLATGESDRLEVATARLRSATAERARLDALLLVRAALGALEDAVRQPLENGVAMPIPEVSPRREDNP